MGVNDAKQAAKEDKVRAAFDKRKAAGGHRRGDETADWGGVDADQLRRTVAAVTRTGDAIRLGYTRDGGAYSIALLHQGENNTEYVGPSEDIDGHLKGIEDDYTD